VSRKKHPIKANPVKAGDAKLWVYRRMRVRHDRQAAEDNNERLFGIIRLA
jgi:hypothetical protein